MSTNENALASGIKLNKRFALTPREVVEAYPELTKSEGTLANWRYQKRGPKFYLVGDREKPVYKPEDIEAHLSQNPVLTIDSMEVTK